MSSDRGAGPSTACAIVDRLNPAKSRRSTLLDVLEQRSPRSTGK